MANNVEPDETACNKPFHQDLQCLQSIWVFARLKGLSQHGVT